MKNLASKRKNKSFITNQDLIEGMRNNSFRNLSKNYGSLEKKSSITLIPKKNFEKENSIVFPKPDKKISPSQQILSVIQELCMECPNKKIIKKAEIAIERFKQEKSKPSNQESDLIKKIEQLYIEKNKLKKERKNLQERIKELEEREQKEGLIAVQRENEKLHDFILKQGEIINQQANQTLDVREDLQRIVFSQAKSIEKSLLFRF